MPRVVWAQLAAVLLCAFGVALLSARAAIPLGLRARMADAPGGRRTHQRITSRFGALPIALGFGAAAALAIWLALPSDDAVNERIRLQGVLIGLAVMFIAALIDDRLQLGPLPQLLLQLVAAGIAVAHLVFIEQFRNPLAGGAMVTLPMALVVAVSLVWHVGMINTVNFLDGVDALAASVAAVASAMLCVHMLREGQGSVALLAVALLGTLLGFLVFNRPPARLFLGGGAQMIGFLLACLSIMAGAKLAAIMLVMGLPIADVALQILSRVRRGQSPFAGDRGHLHLRLKDHGWSARRITALYAALSASFGAIALLPVSPTLKLVALAVAFVAALALLRRFAGQRPV